MEMLVVIGIICILGAMLSPALRKSLATAHQASCANNFRQTGLTFTMYKTDYKGYLPPVQINDPESNGWKFKDWQSQLLLYSNPGWSDDQRYGIKFRNTTIFWCPVTPVLANGQEYTLGGEDQYRTGMNCCLGGSDSPDSVRPKGLCAASPGKAMLEIEVYKYNPTAQTWNWHNYNGCIPHMGTTNILYLDNHVNAQPKILISQNKRDVFWGVK